MNISSISVKSARLRAAGHHLKPKKCLFLCEKVPYLGHLISAHGIRPNPSKTEKVMMFPTPCDVTAVRQFIGRIISALCLTSRILLLPCMH